MAKFIVGSIIDRLCEAGVIAEDPTTVRRVVIDLKAGAPAMVYIEKFGDDESLKVELLAGLVLEQ
jgi:hypothetical protein